MKEQVEQLAPQAAYELWAADYPPHPHNRLMEVEQQAMFEVMPAVKGRTVLDAGCGTGRYTSALEARGARVVGVDLSMAMLAAGCRPSRLRGDLAALPIRTASLDVVVSGLVLGDIGDLRCAIGELARVLRPGGALVYSVVHPDGGPRGWSRTFNRNGRVYAVDGYWHPAAAHRAALSGAGLSIEEWREPASEPGGPPIALVVRAGKV